MRKFLFIAIFGCSTFCGFAQTKSLEIGDTLPNFSYQGQFTKPYQLSNLKGSYVLVHFWASWNEESRKMQLDFIDTYARYKDKKFRKGRKLYIVSMSLDEEIYIWEIAVKKDNLPWKSHLCDGKGWNSPIVTQCQVEAIPANYLLDPNGRIIAKNIKKEELEAILLHL